MSEHKRKSRAVLAMAAALGSGVTGRDLMAGTPDDSPAATPALAPKRITAIAAQPERGVILISARGPLDLADVVVEMPYMQLKHLGAQLILQEIEAVIQAAAGRVASPA